ncbi:MAG: hypothetical protein IPG71_04315 [bacterium]|nr:hypothetical protein [bacterium]
MSDNASAVTCRACAREWVTIEEFVQDEEIKTEGFLPDFARPEQSSFLLRHVTDTCKAMMQLKARLFSHLRSGPTYDQLLLLSDTCEGKCLDYRNLEPCGAKCAMAWTRDVLQCLRTHTLLYEKSASASAS